MRLRIVSVFVVVCVFSMPMVYADVGDMIPAGQLTATSSTSHGTYPDPMVVVNGEGMSGDAHVYTWGSWFTAADDLDRWIVVDLGGMYNVGDVKVWNANEGWGWSQLGFNESAFYVANMADPGNPVNNSDNWTLVTTVVLTEAPGEDGYDTPDVVDLDGAAATHVALRCLATTGAFGDDRAGLSELRFFEGVPPVPGQAYDPVPEVDATGVEVGVVLEWTIGDDPNNPGQPYAEITRHFVWMSDGVSEDLALVDTIDAAEATVYTPPAELDRDSVYYWRVDEGIGDYPAGEPNNIIGKIWSFETEPSTPILDPAYPEDTLVHPLEDAVLEVVATNPFTGDATDLSYQWYKYVDGTNDTPLGGDSATLSISDAGETDEGEYYCVVAITSNPAAWSKSRSASLRIKLLVGHWKLDDNPNEESGMHNGLAYGEPNFADGLVEEGSALDLYGAGDAVVVPQSVLLNTNDFTVSAWAKVTGGSGDFRALISSRNDNPWSGYMIYATASGKWEFWTGTGSGLVQLGSGGTNTNVVMDEWVHVVASFEMTDTTEESLVGTTRLYINGLLAAQQTDSSFVPNDVTDLLIGAGANETPGYDFFFHGLIDDCRTYNYALDATEVGVLYSDVQGSYCVDKPALDYSDNCIVDMADFAIFAQAWLECGLFPECVNTIE